MQLTAQILALINHAVKTCHAPQGPVPRYFTVDQLKAAQGIYEKILTSTQQVEGVQEFVDGEIAPFTDEERTLLKELIQRPWSVVDAPHYFKLKEILLNA